MIGMNVEYQTILLVFMQVTFEMALIKFTSTVQLRYIRTAHTHFIRAYFAYTRMSIRAHVRVYTRTYARIYERIWPFVMHSHKFLYLKHCLSNKGHLWE